MKNKVLKISLIAIGSILGVVIISLGSLFLYSQNYHIPEQDESIANSSSLIQAKSRSLYDGNGNKIRLTGINAGNILLQEGWMSPFALEPLKNDDGTYVKDKDGNIQYPEFAEEEFRYGLKNNPNLKDKQEELMDYYYKSFFNDYDFRYIKNDLGMNCIRLPFYYLNILNEDLTPNSDENAFSYIDWFLTKCQQYELYCILDLHGAPGSQNGFEHSGTLNKEANLWNDENNRKGFLDVWDKVSKYYTNVRPDLGKWIATYDILNEPTYEANGKTTKECWDLFDLAYDIIRANNDNHVITMEGCWDFAALPDPKDYGWENVQYEYHWYNWWSDTLPYDLFYSYQDMSNIGRDYDVPVYIGEFTYFENKDVWAEGLELFKDRNYSWTIWNYKTTSIGWWTSSWGVYTVKLNLDTKTEELKTNILTCTEEEFRAACDLTKTENCVTATLDEVLKAHKGNLY